MLFRRFHVAGLGHYSYLLGCERVGLAAVVDPERDPAPYLRFAGDNDLRIAHVLETHIHADYASGASELADRTGAELGRSAYDRGERFQTTGPSRALHDGDRLAFGSIRMDVIHTPGHTPEHLSFLVYDLDRSPDVPMTLLSGDFLLAGSLGRPDLLGREESEEQAMALHRSVRRKLGPLPDGLEVRPAHGVGSLCGTADLSPRATTTLGYERRTNPLLAEGCTERDFVRGILSSLPPIPAYFHRMKALNAAEPPRLDGLPGREALDVEAFRSLVLEGAVVVDLREAEAFGAGHVPGSIALESGPLLSTWASWVLPPDVPILLVAPDERAVEDAARDLVRVGLDDVRGHLGGGVDAWIAAGLATDVQPQIAPADALRAHREGRIRLVDVRADGDRRRGAIPGAVRMPGHEVAARATDLGAPAAPPAFVCNTGYVSNLATSLVRREGVTDAANVSGGLRAWRASGVPLELP